MFFTTKVSGTHGQGLFVVKRIVQSLHGAVRLKSAPGKGTTFRLLLPAEHEMAQPTHNTISRAGEEALTSQEATVLVVDDEELLRQAVSKMLRKKGLFVIEASDGFGALDVIRRMSVIVTSAKPKEMAAACLSENIERFLRKPFRLGDLLGTIREVLPSCGGKYFAPTERVPRPPFRCIWLATCLDVAW